MHTNIHFFYSTYYNEIRYVESLQNTLSSSILFYFHLLVKILNHLYVTMNLVENSELSRINALLDKFDASDRVFDVKLEILTFSSKRSEISSRQQAYVEYFSYLMNHCFPDYSFRYDQ
uniref:Uncharacterized protein n=1 Tax=Babesia bovis TaxID=5865 RepID=S6BPC3_BABBO|nr:conserved hypothetical protein [Babesia bovis]